MAGLAITSIRAEYLPQDYADEPISRYEQVEISDSWNNQGFDPYSNSLSAESSSPSFASSPAHCNELSILNSSCVVNNRATREGLGQQIRYLKKQPSYQRYANKGVNLSSVQLLNAAQGVLRWLDNQETLSDRFKLVNLSNYSSNKTKFTGYYTPEISARRSRSHEYRFPIHRQPTDNRRTLSRGDINGGALDGSGLEIAWVKDPIDLFYIHIQGSGVLAFENGESKVLQYSGSNGKRFKSIASYMQRRGYLNGDLSRRAITAWIQQHPETISEVFAANPRYVYFTLGDKMASTASGMKLTPGHTVAVDTRFIPFGAVLLAEVPRIDEQGKVLNYQWRLLFPQDRGNAIKGNSRLDFYTGTGEWARHWANQVTGLRRTYLLLEKDQQGIQTASAKSY